MTSPQSPAIKRCLAVLAQAQLGRAAAASAGATPNLSLDLRSRLPTLIAGNFENTEARQTCNTSLETSHQYFF